MNIINTYTFKTSAGEVKVAFIDGQEHILKGKEILDSLFDYDRLSFGAHEGDTWIFVHLYDGYYGTPEYKATVGTATAQELSGMVFSSVVQSVMKAGSPSPKPPQTEIPYGAWYQTGKLHRVDGPAIEMSKPLYA